MDLLLGLWGLGFGVWELGFGILAREGMLMGCGWIWDGRNKRIGREWVGFRV